MKKIIYLGVLLVVFLGCDSEQGLNCFQSAGSIIQEEVVVSSFDKIIVWERVQLIIEQGDTQKVVVETGENLMNDIRVSVIGQQLELRNKNGCNLVRDYGITKVFVTTPNLIQIRNSSGLTVESRGVLHFPKLSLLSEDRDNDDEFHIDGDFNITLETDNLEVIASGLSNFFIDGTAKKASFGVFSGDVRIEAQDLIVDNLAIFQRGSNLMIVNPQNQITGQILSTGDVIAKNRPPIVEVEELYKGRLIFE